MDPLTRYERLKELGAGTYGCVWLARDRETGQKVALKRIKLDSPDEGIPATAIREIAILKELKHRNIVELISVVHTDTKLTLVFEYAETDLKKHLDSQQGRLAPAELKSIMSQILRGLAFVHNRRVLHRDLKPHNILMTKDGVVKIADFGLARGSGIPVRSFTHEVVTLWYRPPEVLLGCRKYGGALDIWSLGCIFYELATGKALFPAKNEQEELLKIFKVCGTPTRESWPGVGELPQWRDDFPVYPGTPIPDLLPNLDEQGRDLFAKMMHIDPAKRISARDALTHPWFTQGFSMPRKYLSAMPAGDPLLGKFAGAAAQAREDARGGGQVNIQDYLREQSFEGSESGMSRVSHLSSVGPGAAAALGPGGRQGPVSAGMFDANSLFNISEIGEGNSLGGDTLAPGQDSALEGRPQSSPPPPTPPPPPKGKARQAKGKAEPKAAAAGPKAKKGAAGGARKPPQKKHDSSSDDWRESRGSESEGESPPAVKRGGAKAASATKAKSRGRAGKTRDSRGSSPSSGREASEDDKVSPAVKKRSPPQKRKGERPRDASALQLSDIPSARPAIPSAGVASSGLTISLAPGRLDLQRGKPAAEPRADVRPGSSGVVVLDALHVERPDKVLHVRKEAPGPVIEKYWDQTHRPGYLEAGERILSRIPLPVSGSAHNLIREMLNNQDKKRTSRLVREPSATQPPARPGSRESRDGRERRGKGAAGAEMRDDAPEVLITRAQNAGQAAGAPSRKAGSSDAAPGIPGIPPGISMIAENTEESIASGLVRTTASDYAFNVIKADKLNLTVKKANPPAAAEPVDAPDVAELRVVRAEPRPAAGAATESEQRGEAAGEVPRNVGAVDAEGWKMADGVRGSGKDWEARGANIADSIGETSGQPGRTGSGPGQAMQATHSAPSAQAAGRVRSRQSDRTAPLSGTRDRGPGLPQSSLLNRPPRPLSSADARRAWESRPGLSETASEPPTVLPTLPALSSGPVPEAFELSAGEPPRVALRDSLSLSDLQRSAPNAAEANAVSPHGVPGFSVAADASTALSGEKAPVQSHPHLQPQPPGLATNLVLSLPDEDVATQSVPLPSFQGSASAERVGETAARLGGKKVTWRSNVGENERPEGYVYRKSKRSSESSTGTAEIAGELGELGETGGLGGFEEPAVPDKAVEPPEAAEAVASPNPVSSGVVDADGGFDAAHRAPRISSAQRPQRPSQPPHASHSSATPSIPSDVTPADALHGPAQGLPFLRPFSPPGRNLALSDTPRMEESISSPKTTESRHDALPDSPGRRVRPAARRQALEDSTARTAGVVPSVGETAPEVSLGPHAGNLPGGERPAHAGADRGASKEAQSKKGGKAAKASKTSNSAIATRQAGDKKTRRRKRREPRQATPESSDDGATARELSPESSHGDDWSSLSDSEPAPQLYDSEAEKLANTRMVSTLVAQDYVRSLEEAERGPSPELLRFLDRASLGAQAVQERFGRIDAPYNTEHFKLVDVPVDSQRVPRSGGGRLLLPQLQAFKGEEFLYGSGPQEIVGVRLAVFDPMSVRPSHRGVVDKGRPFLERHVQKISRGSTLRDPSPFPVTQLSRDEETQQAVESQAEVQVHHRFSGYDWRAISDEVSVARIPGARTTVWHLGPGAVTPKLRSEGDVFSLSTFTVVEFDLFVPESGEGAGGEAQQGPEPAVEPAGPETDLHLETDYVSYDLRQYETIFVPLDTPFRIRTQSRGDTILFSHPA